MNHKFLQNLMRNYFAAGMILCTLFTVVLLFFNLYVGIGAGVLTLAYFFYCKSAAGLRSEELQKVSNELLKDVDTVSRSFMARDPRPLCMIDENGVILWANLHFMELYEQAEVLRESIDEVTPLKMSEIAEQAKTNKYTLVEKDNHTYRLRAYGNDRTMLLYWTDVSALEMLKDLYNESRICIMHIVMDNYDEILANAEDENRAVLAAQLETAVRQWAARHNALALKPRDNRYFLMLEQQDYEKMEEARFTLLDDIRVIETSAEYPASVSVGVGLGGRTLQENEEYADAALDLALGRGGDQVVVKKKTRIEYYGGRLETVEKRNKGKSRIVAHALRQLMDQADNVFIMGHRNPDMDCFGAAGGIAAFARARGKEACIVLEEITPAVARMAERAGESGLLLMKPDAALHAMGENSLLVIVDTSRPQMIEAPELLPLTDKCVLIDHHRKSEDSLEDVTLSYSETYASSTCELVTEILQYASDNKKIIEKNEADGLLAGIVLDTKNFSTKTGVRTFEAASWLRRNGADTQKVRQAFQSSMREVQLRSAIVAGAEELAPGVVLARSDADEEGIRVVMAQAADELLNVEGVKASIVVGTDEGKTVVSARSNGDINVQALMEKLGGGGHLTMAGAQPEGSVDEVLLQIREVFTEEEK